MTTSRTLAVLGGALLLAAVYLIARPYWGIAHDAQLYVGQALNHQHPGLLANDLFFRYGSQDRFTIFSAVFGPLIAWGGVDKMAMAFTVIGAAFGLASAWFALRAVTDGAQALVATIILAAWPGWYGGLRVFSLFEPFATPRVWAIGLILLGMATALRGRYWTSAIAGISAMALHPLMALPGIAWIAFATWPRRGVLAGLLVGSIATVAASTTGMPPFDRVLAIFDPIWRELVQTRSEHLFTQDWNSRDLDAVGCSILGSALVAMRFNGVARRVFASAAGLGALGVVVTVIGSDWAGSVFVTQLQPWRALWISTLATGAGLGLLLARGTDASREDWIAIAGGGAGSLLGVTGGPLATAASIALLIGFRLATKPEVKRLLLLAAALIFAQATAWYLLNRHFEWLAAEVYARYPLVLPFYLRDPALLAILAFAVTIAWHRWQAQILHLTLVVGGAIAVAIGSLDWTGAYVQGRETHQQFPEVPAILARLPVGTNVFWRGDPLIPWLALGRPSYLSAEQTRGIVFSRATALEAGRRGQLAESVLGPQNFLGSSKFIAEVGSVPKPLDSPDAVGLCVDPELGGVYVSGMSNAVPGMPIHDRRGTPIGRFVFCSDVRGSP